MDYEKITLKDLSIADLVSLHNNYWLSTGHGARYEILNKLQFEAVEEELDRRLSNIIFGIKINQLNRTDEK